MLPARAAGARRAIVQLGQRKEQRGCDLQVAVSHRRELSASYARFLGGLRFSPMTDLDQLRRHLQGFGKVLLGYSGGVDSALLAVVGSQTLGAGRFLAVIGRSPSYPEAQWRTRGGRWPSGSTCRCSSWTPASSRTRATSATTPIDATSARRSCGPASRRSRDRQGFDTIIDGTNADDLGEHRPGLARRTRGRNPLAARGARLEQGGRARRQPRAGASHLGRTGRALSSSRVRYGLGITPGRLRQVEEGEAYLRAAGSRGRPPRPPPRYSRERGSRARRDAAAACRDGTRWSASSRGSASSGSSWIRQGIGVAGCSTLAPHGGA